MSADQGQQQAQPRDWAAAARLLCHAAAVYPAQELNRLRAFAYDVDQALGRGGNAAGVLVDVAGLVADLAKDLRRLGVIGDDPAALAPAEGSAP